MIKIRTLKKTKVFEDIALMDSKLFDWKMKGMTFISNDICLFCDKKIPKNIIAYLTKMNQFDSKAIGGVKNSIVDNAQIIASSLSYNLKNMEWLEKEIIHYSIARDHLIIFPSFLIFCGT